IFDFKNKTEIRVLSNSSFKGILDNTYVNDNSKILELVYSAGNECIEIKNGNNYKFNDERDALPIFEYKPEVDLKEATENYYESLVNGVPLEILDSMKSFVLAQYSNDYNKISNSNSLDSSIGGSAIDNVLSATNS